MANWCGTINTEACLWGKFTSCKPLDVWPFEAQSVAINFNAIINIS